MDRLKKRIQSTYYSYAQFIGVIGIFFDASSVRFVLLFFGTVFWLLTYSLWPFFSTGLYYKGWAILAICAAIFVRKLGVNPFQKFTTELFFFARSTILQMNCFLILKRSKLGNMSFSPYFCLSRLGNTFLA